MQEAHYDTHTGSHVDSELIVNRTGTKYAIPLAVVGVAMSWEPLSTLTYTAPVIAFGLLAVYLGVHMLLSKEFTSRFVQAKWNIKGRLGTKLLGLEKTIVITRYSSPLMILVGVGLAVCGLCILLK